MQQGGVMYDGVGKYNDSTFGVPMPHYTANLTAGVMGGNHSLLATVRYLPAMTLQVPNPATNAGTRVEVVHHARSAVSLPVALEQWQQCHGGGHERYQRGRSDCGWLAADLFGNTYTFLGRVFRVGVDYKF